MSIILRLLRLFQRRLVIVGVTAALTFLGLFLFRQDVVEAASVILNGWGCYTGCSWTDPNTGTLYTVQDSNYSPAGPVVGSYKNWKSVVDWFGSPSYIYPSNTVDSSVPCTSPGGYAGSQLHGTSRWTDPDGTVQTQETLGSCIVTNSPPVVTLSCPSNVPTGTVVNCTASASDNTPTNDYVASQSWAGSGPSGGPYFAAGWVTFTATATDSLGASTTKTASVYIQAANQNPTVSISCPSSVTADASGQGSFSCSASGSDPDGDTVTVSMGGSSGTGSVSASFTYAPGTYTISASASDGKGGSASTSASVTVTGAAGTPTATVACSPSSIASDGTATTTCTASAAGGTAPYTYSWGASSKTFGPHTSPGTQSVSVTVTDAAGKSGGGSGTYTVTAGSLTVSVSCSPSNITAPPGSSSCSASVSGGNGSYTYNWSNGSTSSSSTYSNISSATTASASVRDSAGASGSGSSTISVNGSTTTCAPGEIANPDGTCTPPCTPDPDYRSMSTTANPTLVRAGMGYTTVTMSSSGSTSNRSATASWGETKSFQYQNSRWEVTFYPPRGLSGKYTIVSTATISQADGCGGTYGPSSFSSTKTIDVFQINQPATDDTTLPIDDGMTVANMTLADYLKVCLGDMEPWYCGIDARLGSIYLPELQAREQWYMASLGDFKWAKLVKRIDDAFRRAGQHASGLYLP